MHPDAKTYYFESDVQFTKRKRSKSRTLFIGYNYNSITANGGYEAPLEMVEVTFEKKRKNYVLRAQFVVFSEGMYIQSLVPILNLIRL